MSVPDGKGRASIKGLLRSWSKPAEGVLLFPQGRP